MRITYRYLVIAIAAIAIVLVTATGAVMGAQIANASTAPATVDGTAASPGSGPWAMYGAVGIIIIILAVGILYIFRERSVK